MKKRYQKPTIRKEVLEVNYFYTDSRYFDSLDMFQSSHLLSQSSSCVDTCFMPGTRVLMADKSVKEIQEISESEQIISFSLTGKEFKKNPVEKIVEKIYPDGYLVLNNILKITLNHKIWVNNTEWLEAQEVKVGDSLLNSNNEQITVESIQHVPGTFTVYNLHIDGEEHNFFAEDTLVHNQIDECS